MPLSEVVLITMGLLTIAMVTAGLGRKLPIPFTVLLVIIGMVLASIGEHWEPLEALHEFRLTPDLVFFVFLPALIFESGLNLNARQLVKDLAPILTLAVPALLISTALVGLGSWWLLDISLGLALLFGALISATDPVAVVALFKELGAPLRLNILVEGESLLNDATAIVVFGIILSILVQGGGLTWGVAGFALLNFFKVFIGGALVGVLFGLAISELLYRLHSSVSAVLAMSIVMAYASFIVAEHELHVSGVMAAASSAVTLGVFGLTRVPHGAAAALHETWELVALLANSLLFLLVGLSVHINELLSGLVAILVAVALVTAARAATVYTLVPATTRLFSLPRVSLGERHIMWWGGLKGGLAIAIVLSIPEGMAGRELLLSLTLGVVLFTLLVNASTIRPLMRVLGLNRFTDDERSELTQGMRHARETAGGLLDRFRDTGLISTVARHRIGGEVETTLQADEGAARPGQRQRQLYLAAMQAELDELNHLYNTGVISQYTLLDIRNTLQRDREAHSAEGGESERQADEQMSPFLRLEMQLLRRLREHNWAAGLLGRYQNVRLSQRLQRDIAGVLMAEAVLRMLRGYNYADDEAVAEMIALYEGRLERRKQRIEMMREEFPAFYERFEDRLCKRAALTGALRSAEHEYHQGEMGAKPYTFIERLLHQGIEDIPPLSEAPPKMQPAELIAMVPLLKGLSEAALDALAAHAHPVNFLPGDIIIGEGDKGDALYIITHGKVAVFRQIDNEAQKLGELGAGDFFGEMALLGDQVRTATVKAKSPTTLLRLARNDVIKLARHQPEVNQRLREASSARQETSD